MKLYRTLLKQVTGRFNKGHFQTYLLELYRHNRQLQLNSKFVQGWKSLLESIVYQQAMRKGVQKESKSLLHDGVILGYQGFRFNQQEWKTSLQYQEKEQLLDLWMMCQFDYFNWRLKLDRKKTPIFPARKDYNFRNFTDQLKLLDLSKELTQFGIKVDFLKKAQ